ncbi:MULTISPECIES: NAD(P)-dependent oxidoreductase [Mycolicibacterium]|jgi:3-hydroxyisobutyrate dehydrogenase|uniref:3-hydroxyisobutyrate dehydrogenase n=1 Tax=Mycolicibacterium vanbaalenii (strain DSM 7251 / JCM 13017 / BCRC 16820 / KCTC 9966 / NRRL B-24157 / PYR-1) TaxID=350058 RepID=A1TEJ5_MYCVP|nr:MULTISPECIES: NAD(P)-dependent oxidoreductase [Mycolicibacterium]ABM15595.1 3-hydroxyisobutyrate dehydrogenase [Mycolicibacterium vanbaalenii PYR-1]MCV7127544.1 NAD(P)-dependent oxidoreductase [Mycolicibacterium vanbaalenii PYR-1]QZY45178.1 NAD(P)-dependent oxidoreductase [Mycolicibacterium austroafricanum]UJL28952.1 NAD(P)-dependent oxidoreductase [Mycolicibacterium vanbaalenii]WND55666.1 NAD(P)-dependent oxidoreductase [Mycolicibacterium vanbaalenii]
MNTELGFVGLGNMGFPIMTRLVEAGHRVLVFDTRADVVAQAVRAGAEARTSARDVADRAETVLASLPTPQVSNSVASEVAEGSRVRRFVDLSTVGQQAAQRNREVLSARGIAALDSPVSGGVHGARAGTLAVMVSGPRPEFEALASVFAVLGRAIFVSEQPGAAQTMKLINNLMAATALAATAEVMVMGVKAGLDPQVVIDVLNAGSGGTHASRDKFPRAVLPRTFDYGFATGLMTKDVLLYLDEARALGTPVALAESVMRLWEQTQDEEGPSSDFTSVVKPLERIAGVTIGPT